LVSIVAPGSINNNKKVERTSVNLAASKTLSLGIITLGSVSENVVHRQARSSGIPQIARDIRQGTVPALPAFAGTCTGVSFRKADDRPVMHHILGVLATWSGSDDAKVLGVTERGTSGIRNINTTLHLMASANKPKLEGCGFAEGDPIICRTTMRKS
jgi:hypothetical protein